MNTDSITALTVLYGKSHPFIFYQCTFTDGTNIVTTINKKEINIVYELSPELARILKEGYSYSEINQTLSELTREIASIKNVSAGERPTLLNRIANSVEDIKRISEGAQHLKPYAQLLYNGAKAALGLELPDWK